MDDGYYLITSTLGDNLILATTDVNINEKNDYPSLDKTASTTNLSVGDKVTYTITVHVPESATVNDTITVHDTLAEQLKVDESTIAAKLGETDVALNNATAKQNETFARSFTITNDMLGKDVVITYDAELLSTAANDKGYVNSAYLDYSDFETTPSTVEVKTYDFDLTKTFAGSEATNLQATFKLYPQVDGAQGTTAIRFVYNSTTDAYTKADTDDTSTSDTITAENNDELKVSGLAAGTYYLVETGTADGYNALTGAITVTIDTNGNATFASTDSDAINANATANSAVTVVNNAGGTLPSTGGMGTTIFTVAGAALVIGAGALLVTRRRMEK